MGDSLKYWSFAKGELSPDLQGRVDVNFYEIALRICRNFIVKKGGGLWTRPGMQFLGRVKNSAQGQVRLIPFIFSQSLTFVLELGNLYARFYKKGAQVTETAVTITAINQNASCTVTAANSYAAGDEVILSGIVGMTQLNGRNVLVTNPTGANFQIQDLDGNAIDSTGFTAYTSGGQAARVYQLTTPYVTADLQTLNFVQSANVLTIAHNNYPPADISRVSDNSWTYTPIVFQPGIAGPSGIAFSPAQNAAKTISAITNANPMVVTSNGHGFGNGDKIVFSIAGMTELNDLTAATVNNTAANTFQAYYFGTTTQIDSTNFQAFVSGTVTKISGASPPGTAIAYQVTAVAASNQEESLPGLGAPVTITAYSLTASGSVVKLTVPGHGLTSGNTVTVAATNPSQNIVQLTASAQNASIVFNVTSHGFTNGDSLFVNTISPSLLSFFNTNPVGKNWVIANVTANTFTLNTITATGAFGTTPANYGSVTQPYIATYANQTWTIAVVDVNNFTLNGAVTALTLTVSSNTNATITANTVSTSNTPSGGSPNTLSWSAVAGAGQYNIYALNNGVFMFIGSSQTLTFKDTGIAGAATNNPPIPGNPFNSPGNYPAVVGYYQSRLCFANTKNAVAQFWASKPGCRTNFTTHIPLQVGDSATFTIVGNNEVNPIVGMMDCRYLILFTSGGEWAVFGDSNNLLNPSQSFNVVQSSVYGSSTLRPLLVNTEVLYLQAQGDVIRNISYEFTRNNFTGEEITLESNHLFETYTITDWAYSKIPHSVVWAVRSDGTLLAMTYVKDQQVRAWSRHDTIGQVTPTNGALAAIPQTQFGTIENVACVPEGLETAVYVVVNRQLYGSNIRYVERLSSRILPANLDISTYNQMDAALSFDGTDTTGSTLSMPAGGYQDHLTITASGGTPFLATDVGKALFLYTVPTVPLSPVSQVRFQVDTFLSTTQVQGHILGEPVTNAFTTTNWAKAVNKLGGLWHLKNQAVSVMGDAYVIGNPFNTSYATVYQVDAFGNLTLDTDKWYSKITVGLPVTCHAQTLDINAPAKESPVFTRSIVTEVQLMIRESRGVWCGIEPPPADIYGSVDTTQAGFDRLPPRNTDTDGYDQPHQLQITDRVAQPVPGKWTDSGRSMVLVTDPLPVTILEWSAHGTLPPRNPTRQ